STARTSRTPTKRARSSAARSSSVPRSRESRTSSSRSTTASCATGRRSRGTRLRRIFWRHGSGPTMPELDRDGFPLRYEVAGTGGAEFVVLTHGFGATAETWRGQVPALVAAGYRVLTWDLRAHGRSGSPDEAITIATLAEDLAALVRAVGGPAHALGHSAGG